MSRTLSEDNLLTPSQLAKYLHMTEKTVLKLAKEDKLPGVLIDSNWRFKRTHIDKWLEAQTHGGGDFQEEPDGMKVPLGDLLPPEGVIQDMTATTGLEAIEELAGRAYINRWLRDKDWMISALVEREGLSSTAMEGGVAFLHTRQRDTGKLQRPFVIVGRSYDGIEFGAPDGERTFLFFLLGLKYDKLHLPVLGRLARVMTGTRTVAKLRATTSPVKMRAVLLDLDKKALSSTFRSPVEQETKKPSLDRALRLRAIMRISARKQYEAKKAREEAAKEAAKAEKAASKRKTGTRSKAKTSRSSSATTTPKAVAASKKPAAAKVAAGKKNAKAEGGTSESSKKAGRKAASSKTAPAKKAPAKKAPTKKAPTKKAPTKKAPTKKAPAKKVGDKAAAKKR